MSHLPTETPFKDLINLASKSIGSEILFATDDFFSCAEGILESSEPVWIATKYNEFGKWMDGWETRRKRTPGHDWAIIKLGVPGIIKGIHADTAFFTGNQCPLFSIQACFMTETPHLIQRRSELGSECSIHELSNANELGSQNWDVILPRSVLRPGVPSTRHHHFELAESSKIYTHIRVNMFPDGGIARLGVYGTVSAPNTKDIIDCACVLNGGVAIEFTDAHYGTPQNMLLPIPATGMHEGWETARNPTRPAIFETGMDGMLVIPGCHYAIIRLAGSMKCTGVIVETKHYKGNYPESCSIEGGIMVNNVFQGMHLSRRFKLYADARYGLGKYPQISDDIMNIGDIEDCGSITHVKIYMYPDGGISRLRIYGILD